MSGSITINRAIYCTVMILVPFSLVYAIQYQYGDPNGNRLAVNAVVALLRYDCTDIIGVLNLAHQE